MSQYECVVPEMEWNLRQQRQEQVEGSEEKQKRNHHQHYNIDNNNSTSSSHLRPWFQQNLHPIMSNDVQQIEELTWENGQLSMHGHRDPTKPVWLGSKDDTLESIVHQASHNKTNPTYVIDGHHVRQIGDANNNKLFISSSSSPGQKISVETSGAGQTESILMMKKRTRSELEQCSNLFSNSSGYSKGDHYHHHHQQGIDLSLCGSASATFCKDEDATMMTWASIESPRSLKTKKTFYPAEDSASLGISANQDEDGRTKTDQTGGSHSSRRSRVAANHNQSERRRRDRINQKMRALQRLVPNAYKTDKASMLDEVIEYLKQLQAQVQTMMSMRNMNVPHFTMMPLGIAQAQQQQHQQQLQLSLLSRMVGLGMGMGMLDTNSVARVAAGHASPPNMHPASAAAVAANFVPPQFARPTPPAIVPVSRNNSPSLPAQDPFGAFLAQNMNIDLYNKVASLYRQQQMSSSPTTHQMGREQ